jgi:hypothetical protein
LLGAFALRVSILDQNLLFLHQTLAPCSFEAFAQSGTLQRLPLGKPFHGYCGKPSSHVGLSQVETPERQGRVSLPGGENWR